eukprot:g8968.t1
MRHRHHRSGAVLLAGFGLLESTGYAFVAPPPRPSPNFPWFHDLAANAVYPGQQHRAGALSMAWSAEERTEIIQGLADWQERDVDGVGAADVKILTESSPTAVLTRYYESLTAGEAQQMLLVAPSCSIESDDAQAVEAALSSVFVSKVYHPDVEEGLGGKAPHLALWHEEVSASVFSPSSVLEQQTSSLSQKAVMEEVFLWLQRTMLGMVDDEEEIFIELGRKLLTVHKYVVVNATTEAELSREFWQEAAALAKHGVTAAAEKEKKDAEEAADRAKKEAAERNAKAAAEEKRKSQGAEEAGVCSEDADVGEELDAENVMEQATEEQEAGGVEDVLKASGLGGGDNPKEDSVLMALPGFRFKDRPSFEKFVEDKLVAPLKALSPLGVEGVELSADIYAGEDLKFPVIIISPPLEKFEAPEGGYKFINGRGEERDADAYIQEQELKLAEQAAERAKKQQLNPDPLFGPRPPRPVDDDDKAREEDDDEWTET